MKCKSMIALTMHAIVAPARERGLKYGKVTAWVCVELGRSREGAWIEINTVGAVTFESAVAPARERGLKYLLPHCMCIVGGRSREGAWIEISAVLYVPSCFLSLPRGSVD